MRPKTAPRAPMRGWLVLLLLLACAHPGQARPKVLVVLADHLTLADVTRSDVPGLARMRQGGRLGLLSPGLAHGPDPVANVYAALGAGDSVRVGDVSQGRMGQALRAAGIRTALVGDADGDDTGVYRPALQMLPRPDRLFAGGTVPDPTAPGGRRVDPARLWGQTRAALRGCDLVLVHFGDFARAEREDQQGDLLTAAYQAHRRRALQALDVYLGEVLAEEKPPQLFLIVPTPPLTSRGDWDSLAPLVLYPASPRKGRTVQSDTTQTLGLVAARDLAPTVLKALGVAVPLQMTGAVIEPAGRDGGAAVLDRLFRLDRLTRLNQDVQNPLFWTLGSVGAFVAFGGLGLSLTGRLGASPGMRRAVLYGLRALSAWPLALLLAPLADPATAAGYLGLIAALTGLLALLPSPTLIFSLTALMLVADGLTGTTLVSQSVLSVYALSGIRFYGIGNEYMGVLLGGALLLASASPRPSASPRGAGVREGVFFALVAFVLSFPAFGAKAGGAITATVTFTLAWLRLRGVSIRAKHILVSVAAGFALVFLWALLGHVLDMRRTHIDTAVSALGQGRLGYILGVALRKIGLAVQVFLHPGTLLGILAFVLVGLIARLCLRSQVTDYLARHARFAAVWEAGLWGSLIAVLFNDSGIVAAILLLMSLILTLLYGLLEGQPCASSPSTSATSESASPSATA